LYAEEVLALNSEGFPKGQARSLLKKNNGNVEAVRKELVLRRSVGELASEGFPKGKCRKTLIRFNGDVDAARRELGENASDFQELVNEGIPRKLANKLMKKFKGDVSLAREHYLKSQVDDANFREITEELFNQGYKPRRRVTRLLYKYNGDTDKVKEEISATRKRPRNEEPSNPESKKNERAHVKRKKNSRRKARSP